MEANFIIKWGNFDKLWLENWEGFLLKWKINIGIYMTAPLIKYHE